MMKRRDSLLSVG